MGRIFESLSRRRLLCRESNAVNRRIRFTEIPDNLLHRRFAAVIALLAYQQNRATVTGWFLLQQLQSERDSIKDRRAAVPLVRMVDCLAPLRHIRGKRRRRLGLAIEVHYRDLVRRSPQQTSQHRLKTRVA